MEQINMIKLFLGWCSIINIGVYLFSVFFLIVLQKYILNFHSKLFNLSEIDLSLVYFKFLAVYKIAIIIFNITPYLALLIIS